MSFHKVDCRGAEYTPCDASNTKSCTCADEIKSDSRYPYSPLSSPILHTLPTRHHMDKDSALDVEKTSLLVPGIVHHGLFSNDKFAITPRTILIELDQVFYDLGRRMWLQYPTLCASPVHTPREYALINFLNDFTRACCTIYANKAHPLPVCARQWVVTDSTRILSNGDAVSTLGIALADAGLSGVQWSDVLCDVQVASTATDMPEVMQRLSSGAANVFMAQEDRMSHVGIALAGDDLQIAYFDRAGRALSGVYNIHEHAVFFARTIMALTILDKSLIGKDMSIVSRDGRRFVTVGGLEYEIVETLSMTKSIRGRGTICWRCRRSDSDEDFVIKNVWADMRRTPSEGELLSEARGIAGIADLVCDEAVLRPDGRPCNTAWVLDMFAGVDGLSGRSHLELRRLVLRPYARPLAEFSSKDELLRVFRDAVAAHGDLYEREDILHCDISDNNIMIRQQAGSKFRRGLLIDLDCAIKVTDVPGKLKQGYSARRTGTIPYMAYDVLWGCVRRGPWHDLESFIYVLMVVCASYSGPSNTPRKNFDLRACPLAPWLEGDANHKCRIMMGFDDVAFRTFLDSVFDPYFDDLKDLVCDLRAVILRTTNEELDERQLPCHTDVLSVFDRHIRARQAALVISANTQLETGRSPSVDGDNDPERRKRKRGGVRPKAPDTAKPRASRTRGKAASSSSEYSDDSERTLVAHGRPAKKAKTVADAENVVGWERSPDTGRLIRCWRRRKVDHLA
ncbi:hypothetical protein BD626DRAFT_122699 [Schizophyllum amplum]|uniref:Fungal-type protein kinase domain-containing protein n=1 Tax=Schizophyllum amplum TaxID=97359 RepID=A0A550C806_9AGAR|nr:hypothetical protein BD626DRAFT_122699 [Auriculariopsis ampla]